RTSLSRLKEPLPGPAAVVQAIPSAEQLITELSAAGFVDLHFEKLAEAPCFLADGVECRETRLVGAKPHPRSPERTHQMRDKWPLRRVSEQRGNAFARGGWVDVDGATWLALQAEPLVEQFCFSSRD